MKDWVHDPVWRFLALGTCLFAFYSWIARPTAEPVVLTAAAEAVLVSEFELLTGKSATSEDVARLVDEYFLREVLFREGLKVERARSDAAIREAIVESMQQEISGDFPEPDSRQLLAFYTDNMQRYYSEPTVSVTQVYFEEKPGPEDAVLAALASGENPGADTPWQGETFPDYGVSMLRGLFGQPLLQVMLEVPLGEWRGPFESPDGWHFFRVDARGDPRLLPFEQVQGQLLADYQSTQLDQQMQAFIESKQDAYVLQREES